VAARGEDAGRGRDDRPAAAPLPGDEPRDPGKGRAAAPLRTTARPLADVPLAAEFHSPAPIDLRRTMAPLANGPGDPAFGFRTDGAWLARRTERGTATVHVWGTADGVRTDGAATEIHAQAWGPGAVPALAAVPGIAGLLDDPTALSSDHPLLREIVRRHAGVRLPRTGQLLPPLVAAVTGQKVTATEAHAAWAGIVRRFGEPAPGPTGTSLIVPPTAERLAGLPYFEFHRIGLERRRAETIVRVARRGAEIEALMAATPADAIEALQRIPGIGPWSAAEAVRAAFGDPDAVSLGDLHLPDLVAWTLAREPRGDDARMLELLAPYAGQRARVVRLLEASGIRAPRFGPRFAPRRIGRI
jgi:3-methyladenine DNA glycosylase/8-oxoguanine DNA glycosylase